MSAGDRPPATAPDQRPAGRATDPGRVVEVHRQARRTLAIAACFTVAAPVAAVAPLEGGAWLPLHLFLVGGLVGAISGATQLLAVTWAAAPAPPARLAAAQRWLLAAGAVAVAAGRHAGHDALSAWGGAAVAASMALLGTILLRIRAGATTRRFHPAIDAYLLAVMAGLAGTGLAVAMVTEWAGRRWLELRGAHLTVNVQGLVGLVVAGTLPYFVATQARTKMSRSATPARVRGVVGLLAAATTLAAGGHLVGELALARAGLVVHAVGIAALVALLPVPGRRQLAWAGPRLVQLGAGIGWWFAVTVVLALTVEPGGAGQAPALQALAVGGFGQLLMASLAYFGPVLRGGGHRHLAAGFRTTRSWVGLVAANVAAAALLVGWTPMAAAALGAWVLDALARAIQLLSRWRPA